MFKILAITSLLIYMFMYFLPIISYVKNDRYIVGFESIVVPEISLGFKIVFLAAYAFVIGTIVLEVISFFKDTNGTRVLTNLLILVASTLVVIMITLLSGNLNLFGYLIALPVVLACIFKYMSEKTMVTAKNK